MSRETLFIDCSYILTLALKCLVDHLASHVIAHILMCLHLLTTYWELYSTEKLSVEFKVFTLVVWLPECVHHPTHLACHMTQRLLAKVLGAM